MASEWLDPGNPYLWLFGAGLFLAIGVQPLLVRRAVDPNLGLLFCGAALGVGSAAASLVVPHLVGQTVHPEPAWVLFVGLVGVGGAVGIRFRRAAGIPLAVLAIAWVAAVVLALAPFVALHDPHGELGTLRVLSATGGAMQVELDRPTVSEPFVTVLAGSSIALDAERVDVSPLYFFVSARRFGRLADLGSAASRGYGSAVSSVVQLPSRHPSHPALLALLPGVRTLPLASPAVVPDLLDAYEIEIDDGGLRATRRP